MKYQLVQWPESQLLMEHERFEECLFVQDIEGHSEVGSAAYMCPEDLYNELFTKEVKDRVLSILSEQMEPIVSTFLSFYPERKQVTFHLQNADVQIIKT